MTFTETTFAAMGTQVRLVLGPGGRETTASARAWLEDAADRLSRFLPDSELSRLNADPRAVVPASALLRAAVAAGLWAARRSCGLVDPTLVGDLEDVGYARSRRDEQRGPLAAALAQAPRRAPARAHPAAAWQTVAVDAETITRPPGVRLDTGGTGKGLLADALAHRLADHDWAVVDCGGDIRVAGAPFPVDVRHPLTGEIVERLVLDGAGVATSGIDRHVWRGPDGAPVHHLLDPATGRPAWTGLVGATALAPTALEAEALAKLALLSGPDGARDALAEHGGIAFHDDGTAERVGL